MGYGKNCQYKLNLWVNYDYWVQYCIDWGIEYRKYEVVTVVLLWHRLQHRRGLLANEDGVEEPYHSS